MEKDQPKYSLDQIERARTKESIIVRWQSGEKLVKLMKEATIQLTRACWWNLKRLYQKYGFPALLDKRGGRVTKIGPEVRGWIGFFEKIFIGDTFALKKVFSDDNVKRSAESGL